MNRANWDKIDAISYRSMGNELEKNTDGHKQKLERLNHNQTQSNTDTSGKVINLSNQN